MNSQKSILEMARGALMERADYELERVIENILDANTPPDKKRKLTVTLELTPSGNRSMVAISASAKSTLCATEPIQAQFWIGMDKNGVPGMREMLAESPDQTVMEEIEQQAQPVIVTLGKAAMQAGKTQAEG